jgi:hypothetical protein
VREYRQAAKLNVRLYPFSKGAAKAQKHQKFGFAPLKTTVPQRQLELRL